MSCGIALVARRNSDERWTFTPRPSGYTFSGMAPLFTVRRDETILLQIDQTMTVNGSVFSVVGDSVSLTLKKEDAAVLDSSAPDTKSEHLFYDVTLTDGAAFENWVVGGAFTLLGINDVSCGGCNETVEVNLGGACIQVVIEGGNTSAGASINLDALDRAVKDAEKSAADADADANAAAAAAAAANAAAASIPGLISGKADTDGENLSASDASSFRHTLAVPFSAPEDFGANGYTGPDSTAPNEGVQIQNMLYSAQLGEEVTLRKSYLTDSFINTAAVVFQGPGEVLAQTTPGSPSIEGGYALLGWDDDAERDVTGEEYLYAIRKVLAAPSYADRIINGFAYGDSTWDQNGTTTTDPANLVQNALPNIAQTIGLPGTFQIVNEAKSGTTLEDAANGNTRTGSTPLGNLGPTNHISLFKFGLNEGLSAIKAQRPASFASSIAYWIGVYNSVFSAMRSHPWGSVATHTIIVMGPNSASNIGYQDQRWLKKWIIALKRLCRQYHIVYFDTYDRWADSLSAADKWLDGPATYGPLHPTDTGWATIWAAFGEFLRAALVTDGGQTNRLMNPTSFVSAPFFSTPPSAFRPGISMHRVSISPGGWYAPGKVITTVSGDNDCHTQTLELQGANRSYTRRKLTGSDAWSDFSNIDTGITLSNGWDNFGSGQPNALCRISTDGNVRVSGLIKSGATALETVVGTLPAGFRPGASERFIVSGAGGVGVAMRVDPSGDIVIDGSGASATYLSLSGISFWV